MIPRTLFSGRKIKEANAVDLVYLGVVIVLFALSFGLLALCEHL